MYTTIRCFGYERDVLTKSLEYYRKHYGNKGEAYCLAQLGHLKSHLPTHLAEAYAIQERLDQLASNER